MRILLTLRRSVQKFPPGGACVEVGIRKGGEETSTSVATFSCLSPYPKVLIVPKGSLFAIIIINEEEFARGFQEERETTTEK